MLLEFCCCCYFDCVDFDAACFEVVLVSASLFHDYGGCGADCGCYYRDPLYDFLYFFIHSSVIIECLFFDHYYPSDNRFVQLFSFVVYPVAYLVEADAGSLWF